MSFFVKDWKWFADASFSKILREAENGDVKCQHNLASSYKLGEGVQQDFAEAAKWYRKAAEQNDAGSQSGLGVCYANGEGVAQDYAEAVKWYRKAAEQNFTPSQYNLAQHYKDGAGVPKDICEAYKWLVLAAKRNNRLAEDVTKTEGMMSPEEIAEGTRRANDWLKNYKRGWW